MLDKISIQNFLDQGVNEIFISFVQKGCAGTKVAIVSEFDKTDLVSSEINPGLRAFFRADEQKFLSEGRITGAKGKWIFASEAVTDRCGCASSFSFEKQLVDKNKLAKLRGIFGKHIEKE